jgi:hypothetical protein
MILCVSGTFLFAQETQKSCLMYLKLNYGRYTLQIQFPVLYNVAWGTVLGDDCSVEKKGYVNWKRPSLFHTDL